MKKYVLYYNVGGCTSTKAKELLNDAVEHIKSNFLDVDDKIIGFAQREGETRLEVLS